MTDLSNDSGGTNRGTETSVRADPRAEGVGGAPYDEAGAGGTRHVHVATMTDVAKMAGVSTSTVSRFLRGDRVQRGEEIAAAAEHLRYRPNMAARELRSRKRHAIGVIVHDITNPYLAAVVRGVHSVATGHRYNVYLAEGNEAPEEAVHELSSRVDGFICAAVTDESDVLSALEVCGRPAVLLEFEPRDRHHRFDAVMVEDEIGARRGVNYLTTLGHRRIGLVAGPSTTSPGRDRLRGAELALQDAGVEVWDDYLEVSDFSWEGGYQATARLMGRDPPPTAVFVANNLMALGSLHCLHELGARIPAEVSFIGFDPLVSCELFNPPPTTVDRPQSEQGALAMRLLESRIAGRAMARPRRITLETHLAVRQSCAPPPTER